MSEDGPRAAGGIAAAAVAVGVAQLLGAAFGPEADVRTAVGSAVIELTPGPVKEWAIQLFGTANKLVLSVAILVVIALLAAVAGLVERKRRPIGSAMIAIAGVVGCAAVLSGGRHPDRGRRLVRHRNSAAADLGPVGHHRRSR